MGFWATTDANVTSPKCAPSLSAAAGPRPTYPPSGHRNRCSAPTVAAPACAWSAGSTLTVCGTSGGGCFSIVHEQPRQARCPGPRYAYGKINPSHWVSQPAVLCPPAAISAHARYPNLAPHRPGSAQNIVDKRVAQAKSEGKQRPGSTGGHAVQWTNLATFPIGRITSPKGFVQQSSKSPRSPLFHELTSHPRRPTRL